jgi:hypothetical protein
MTASRAESNEESVAADASLARRVSVGAGGSAMPWGLVLPGARAKEVEGDWEPEVRLAAASN